MEKIAQGLVFIIIVVTWLMGIVIASGFWQTFISIILPFYAWYLLIEKFLHSIGWV